MGRGRDSWPATYFWVFTKPSLWPAGFQRRSKGLSYQDGSVQLFPVRSRMPGMQLACDHLLMPQVQARNVCGEKREMLSCTNKDYVPMEQENSLPSSFWFSIGGIIGSKTSRGYILRFAIMIGNTSRGWFGSSQLLDQGEYDRAARSDECC